MVKMQNRTRQRRDTKKLIGNRIQTIRKLRNMSQEAVAEKIGIDSKHLSRIEVGRNFSSLPTIEKLAEILDVEMRDFFDFYERSMTRDELRQNILEKLERTSKENLEIILKILRILPI
jgi:transcriptional regulator with XRE-family HTH domain